MSHIRKTPSGRFEVRYRALIESTLGDLGQARTLLRSLAELIDELEELEPDAIPLARRGTGRHGRERHGTGRHVNRRPRTERAGPWQPGQPDDKWEGRA